MKSIQSIILLLLLSISSSIYTQNLKSTKTIVEELSIDPSYISNHILIVNNLYGFIKIKSHKGKKIKVEVTKTVRANSVSNLEKGKREIGVKSIQQGTLTFLYLDSPKTSFNIKRGKYNQIDRVHLDYTFETNITVYVPPSINLKVKSINKGEIFISDIKGNIDVSNVIGNITMDNISGSVIAHNLEDDIIANFKEIPKNSNIVFSTLSGDVDLSLPKNTQGDIKVKSVLQKTIYTDFKNMSIGNRKPKIDTKKSRKTSHKLKFAFWGEGKSKNGHLVKLGDKNPQNIEFLFRNISGNIIIRSNN